MTNGSKSVGGVRCEGELFDLDITYGSKSVGGVTCEGELFDLHMTYGSMSVGGGGSSSSGSSETDSDVPLLLPGDRIIN